jgi:hypothetical protein
MPSPGIVSSFPQLETVFTVVNMREGMTSSLFREISLGCVLRTEMTGLKGEAFLALQTDCPFVLLKVCTSWLLLAMCGNWDFILVLAALNNIFKKHFFD